MFDVPFLSAFWTRNPQAHRLHLMLPHWSWCGNLECIREAAAHFCLATAWAKHNPRPLSPGKACARSCLGMSSFHKNFRDYVCLAFIVTLSLKVWQGIIASFCGFSCWGFLDSLSCWNNTTWETWPFRKHSSPLLVCFSPRGKLIHICSKTTSLLRAEKSRNNSESYPLRHCPWVACSF